MKVLIVYGTSEHQTRKICRFIQDELTAAGHEAELDEAGEILHLIDVYDAYVLASPVHTGHYHKEIKRFADKHHGILNKHWSAFISVSLTQAGNNPSEHKELESITQEFIKSTHWNPTKIYQVAGALRYSQYNFITKFIMKRIAKKSGGDTDTSRDYEYTDWDQVKRIAQDIYKIKDVGKGMASTI